jgi:hypothetical protein
MRMWLLVIGLFVSYTATAQYSRCSDLQIGDTVEQYRHWNHENRRWNNWPEERFFGTKWRIVELFLEGSYKGKPNPMIRLQLIQGESRLGDTTYKPGHVDLFFSSENYMEANPRSFFQLCDEFRKAP